MGSVELDWRRRDGDDDETQRSRHEAVECVNVRTSEVCK